MPEDRPNPYGNFNFLVDFSRGANKETSVRAGFQEVSGLNIEVTSADYRNGNDKPNHVRKINGIYKVGDVTFKRGLIGALDLYEWIKEVREGSQEATRNVTVELQDEAKRQVVMTW